MEFNPNQKKAINCDENCVVSAGAGSGKTEVLSARFLRLVKEGKAHCNQILTITFTRKATAEMRERIHEYLLKEGMLSELKLFSSCEISTVDGFCSSVVRADCTRYGFSTDFSMMDQEDEEQISLKIADKILTENIETEAVRYLVKNLGVNNSKLLFQSVAKNDLNITDLFDSEENTKKVLEYSQKQLEIAEKEFNDVYESFYEFLSQSKSYSNYIDNLKKIKECCASKNFAEISYYKIDARKGSAEEKEQIKEYRDSLDQIVEKTCVYQNAIENKENLRGIFALIQQFEAEFIQTKRQRNALSFRDIIALTLNILETNKKLRKYYKEKFKYIMIDEFQDNNDDYRKLLYLLAEKNGNEIDGIPTYKDLEPCKIFLVGDEKQSIYRFRGADVSVFKQLCNEIENQIELNINYRSQKELVNFFNIIFGKIMENNGENFEADFKQLESKESQDIRGSVYFYNFFHPFRDYAKNYPFECATPSQSEAKNVADLVKRMLTTDDFLIKKDGKIVRPKESDIAILLHRTSHQNDYEKALKLQKIKFITAEARGLTEEALFNDFYNILQLCVYPYDRIALVAFCKGPLCALSDTEISQIDFQNIPLSISEKIENVRQILKKLGLTSAIHYIYYEMGYRMFLISNSANQAYCEHYDYLFVLAQQYEKKQKTVTEFLDYLRPMLGDFTKIREVTVYKEDNNGVNIMTIHKSKGLGFPIVIVAGMNDSQNNPANFNISTQMHDGTLFVNSAQTLDNRFVNVYTYTRADAERKMEVAELKRLLYVAATRAKFHLVFSAHIAETKTEKEDSSPSMTKMLMNAIDFDKDSQTSLKTDVQCRTFDLVPIEETFSKGRLNLDEIDKKAVWYSNCEVFSPDWSWDTVAVTELCHQKISDKDGSVVLKSLTCDNIIKKYDISTEFGTLCHSLIEESIKNTQCASLSAFSNLSEEELDILLDCAKLLADGFINSSLYSKIKNQELYSEKEFLMNTEGTILTGKIDLLAVSSSEVSVIDFKTDKLKNPSEYEMQLSYYEKAVCSLYPTKKVQKYLVYLRELV